LLLLLVLMQSMLLCVGGFLLMRYQAASADTSLLQQLYLLSLSVGSGCSPYMRHGQLP
jgi:hypothetical protein